MNSDFSMPGLAGLGLLVVIAVGMFLTYHKARRAHQKLFEAERLANDRCDNLYAQFEALLALYHDLKPVASFPGTRGWAGSPDFLRHIARTAATHKPYNIVECSSGTSTIVLARSAQLNNQGHVYSLEHDPVYAGRTRAELKRQGLEGFATVLDAPLREYKLGEASHLWYETGNLPTQIDLLVIDGPPMTTQALARYPAIPILHARFASNIKVLLDDAARPDEQAAVMRWKEQFGMEHDQDLHAEKGIASLRRKLA